MALWAMATESAWGELVAQNFRHRAYRVEHNLLELESLFGIIGYAAIVACLGSTLDTNREQSNYWDRYPYPVGNL